MKVCTSRPALIPLSKHKWIKDSETDFCNACTHRIIPGPFSSNKHHCRYCGSVVCSKCSDQTLNDLRICSLCNRIALDIVDAEFESDRSDEIEELSPWNTPMLKYQEFTASGSDSMFLESELMYRDDIEFKLDLSESHHVDIEQDQSSIPWGAFTEPSSVRCDRNVASKGGSFDGSCWSRFVRSDAAKRDLVTGFVRDCWRTLLQFDGFAFPSSAVIGVMTEWLTVSDGIDEYHTALGIIHHHEALCYLRNYRSVETIERTKEWNRECYHSFGSDVWSRGARNVWKVKVSGHDDNAQKTCILIGIVEADKVEQFTEHSDRRHVGSFSDEEHGGYALLTGNWRTYHEDSDQGQLFSASADPIALTLSPNDVMAVEIDFTPKYEYGPRTSSRCGTLKYALNGSYAPFQNGGVAFDDIDIDKSYRFAVGMFLRDRLALYQVV